METLRKRIARKNLPIEHQISDEYLEEVIKAYEHFFFHYKGSNLLVIDTSEIDFIDYRFQKRLAVGSRPPQPRPQVQIGGIDYQISTLTAANSFI